MVCLLTALELDLDLDLAVVVVAALALEVLLDLDIRRVCWKLVNCRERTKFPPRLCILISKGR